MKYWQNDDRLRAVRERIMDLGMQQTVAELNLKTAVKYADPPDEDAADRYLLELASLHERIGMEQRELVRQRQVVKAEYAPHAPRTREGGHTDD